eukprot:scaffold1365_cov78-Cylindrotheca_fusiformis.AAC.2
MDRKGPAAEGAEGSKSDERPYDDLMKPVEVAPNGIPELGKPNVLDEKTRKGRKSLAQRRQDIARKNTPRRMGHGQRIK